MSELTPIIDTSIRPQDDFFQHVNKKWLEKNPIPKSESRWGTFNVLRDTAWQAMRDIYENAVQLNPKAGSVEQQVGDFYFTGMHIDDLQRTHLTEMRKLLADIDSVTSPVELSAAIGTMNTLGISAPWINYVDADHDDGTKHILHFRQAGLTLPNRDYYLEDSEKMQIVRAQYKDFVHKAYKVLPELAPSANELWQNLIDFEMAIAKVSRPSADLRDVENNYHHTPFSAVKSKYTNIDWTVFATAFGWQPDDKITIDQPEFMAFTNASINNVSIDTWKIYMKWRLAARFMGKINSEFAELHFAFFGKVLSGTDEMMPLWKRVVLTIEADLGEAAGELYVKKHFPKSSKKQVLEIVEEVRESYADRIDALDWMSDKTKAYAKKKLKNIKVLIGYPDTWRDFSGLSITRESYLGNVVAASKFDTAYWLKRLHEPTSRDEWFMTPQTVNAYHDPNRLVICFPAGILQPPFFSPDASLASNYGGIGTVIGHELTHGFDDQGSEYDAEGNVKKWQNEEERKAFKERADVIVKQADEFEVLPGLNLRGSLILGESIADLGGIEIALQALKKKDTSPEALKEFFITYTLTECAKVRDEKLREYTISDPHPNSEFRVNGMLQHVDDFYKTYDVTSSDNLYRPDEDRARIW